MNLSSVFDGDYFDIITMPDECQSLFIARKREKMISCPADSKKCSVKESFMEKFFKVLASSMLFLLCISCSNLLPSSKVTIKSPWKDYESARQDYMKIIPGATTLAALKALGFDPNQVPNIRIMRSTEIIGVYIPNSSIEIESLAPGIQKCIQSKANCIAYMIEPSLLSSKRTGNFWADMFTFKRTTTTNGWEFRGLVIIVDGIVTYRDPPGGRPLISSEEIQKKPLGPLQEIGTIFQNTTQTLLQ